MAKLTLEGFYPAAEYEAVAAELANLREDFNGRLKPAYDYVDGIAVSIAEDEVDRLAHKVEVLTADLARCESYRTKYEDKILALEAELRERTKSRNAYQRLSIDSIKRAENSEAERDRLLAELEKSTESLRACINELSEPTNAKEEILRIAKAELR